MGETPYLRENRTSSVNKPHILAALGITGDGASTQDFPEGLRFFSDEASPNVIRIHA